MHALRGPEKALGGRGRGEEGNHGGIYSRVSGGRGVRVYGVRASGERLALEGLTYERARGNGKKLVYRADRLPVHLRGNRASVYPGIPEGADYRLPEI